MFDVTQLLTWKYGDADKAEIPLIVQSAEGNAAKALRGTQAAKEWAGLGLAGRSVLKAEAGQTWQGLVSDARSLAAGKSKIWLDGKRPFVLALTAVRYAPKGLDEYNRAKPGSSTLLPIWIERNPGAPAAAVKSIRLQMSVDDGVTWQRIPVRAKGSGWTTRVTNPPTAGFVSLRAMSIDTAGNTVSQIIHRAYAVG